MPNLPYPHTHTKAHFRALKNVLINDDGEFTHKCLNCGNSTAYEYEDMCEAGCDVLIVECITCNLTRERNITD
jgi:hypothetical protein